VCVCVCVCAHMFVSDYSVLKRLADFYSTWYELPFIGGHIAKVCIFISILQSILQIREQCDIVITLQ
jgi:hypothetical protein